MAHIYETGTRAWQPDPTDGWVASELVDKQIDGDKVKLVFQLENGEVRSRPRGGAMGNMAEHRLTMQPRRKKPSRRP
jgi:myosin heavy subunit